MGDDLGSSELEFAQRPDSTKKLRACKTCKLIKTSQQFHETYCENCPFSHPDSDNAGMRDDYVQSSTTPDFEGISRVIVESQHSPQCSMVSMMQPQHSWVAKWLKMRFLDEDGETTLFKPGVYAISLPGVEAETAAADAAAAAGDRSDEDEGDDADDDEERDEAAAAGEAEAHLDGEEDEDEDNSGAASSRHIQGGDDDVMEDR